MSAHRDSTSGNTANTGDTTLALTKPVGLAAGDWVTAFLHVINNVTQNSWTDIILPTDWFLLGDANGDSDAYAKSFMAGYIATGSEGASFSFGYSDPSAAANTYIIIGILSARSGHDAIPFDHTTIETNTATGGSATTLVRTGAGWTTNVHAGRILRNITTGKYGFIASNTGDTLTIRHAMGSANANTNSYAILTAIASVQFNSSFASTAIAPSVTTVAANAQLVSFYAGADGNHGSFGDNLVAPAGQTERLEINTDSRGGWGRIMVADEALTSAGSTGTRTASLAASWQSFCGSIALREPVSGGSNLLLLRNFNTNHGLGLRA